MLHLVAPITDAGFVADEDVLLVEEEIVVDVDVSELEEETAPRLPDLSLFLVAVDVTLLEDLTEEEVPTRLTHRRMFESGIVPTVSAVELAPMMPPRLSPPVDLDFDLDDASAVVEIERRAG